MRLAGRIRCLVCGGVAIAEENVSSNGSGLDRGIDKYGACQKGHRHTRRRIHTSYTLTPTLNVVLSAFPPIRKGNVSNAKTDSNVYWCEGGILARVAMLACLGDSDYVNECTLDTCLARSINAI